MYAFYYQQVKTCEFAPLKLQVCQLCNTSSPLCAFREPILGTVSFEMEVMSVIPAKAGIQFANLQKYAADELDSRFRGNDCDLQRVPMEDVAALYEDKVQWQITSNPGGKAWPNPSRARSWF